MYKGYSLHSVGRIAFAIALFAVCAFSIQVNAQQYVPQTPRLSLVGGEGDYNHSWYPDGRIWATAAGDNGPTEILVPVFMKNCWRSRGQYQVHPIYSFNFKLQYDSTALKPVGVATRGPWMRNQHPNVQMQTADSATLAAGWQINWDVAVDSTYQVQNGLISANNPNRLRGKRIRISAESSRPLDPTGDSSIADCNAYDYRPLLFIKFQVLGRPGLGVSDASPLIITTDSIYYNNMNAVQNSPFPGDINYPQPQTLDRVVAGIDYTRIGIEPAAVNTITKGMIYCHIRDQFQFDFLPKPTGNPNETSVTQLSDTLFSMTRIIPLDPNAQQSIGQAINEIQVVLTPDGVRATNIIVESDKPWLLFKTRGSKNPIPSQTRFGRIAYIDRGILGPNGLAYPDVQNGPSPNQIDPLMNFDIICDPSQLIDTPDPNNPDEYAGRYVGYITFRSATAQFTPIRLRVEFLVVRSPDETYNGAPPEDKYAKGMLINVSNSASTPQSADLMFGTGLRATYGVDTLFGEFAYATLNQSSFYARFFQIPTPKNTSDDDIKAQLNGFGDITGVYASRDVRNVFEDTTIVYECHFNAGGDLNYPIVLTWDVNQFPDGAQLYLRDIENGSHFGIDMRQATPIPGPGQRMSYTIRDQKITAFDIEYTPSRAKIQETYEAGWNFVSLPVRPSTNDYRVLWPTVPGQPIKYAISYYQQENYPQVGYGYFLRFPTKIDQVISGILVKRIAKDVYPVHLYQGWNTIGSLSVPVGSDQVHFDPVSITQVAPTQLSGIYGYVTDRGYREVTELEPGRGYWVKLSDEGYLNLAAPITKGIIATDRESILNASAKLNINDAAAHTNTLYMTEGRAQLANGAFELPPVPPYGLFDARFATTESYVTSNSNPEVSLQGVQYPVRLSIGNSRTAYTVVDNETGVVLGTFDPSINANTVVINDENVRNIRLMNSTMSVVNYSMTVSPNPAIDHATVNFSVPENQNVSVKLYNAMGQEISTIFNGFALKGDHSASINASELINGSYIVKIVANDFVSTQKINIVR